MHTNTHARGVARGKLSKSSTHALTAPTCSLTHPILFHSHTLPLLPGLEEQAQTLKGQLKTSEARFDDIKDDYEFLLQSDHRGEKKAKKPRGGGESGFDMDRVLQMLALMEPADQREFLGRAMAAVETDTRSKAVFGTVDAMEIGDLHDFIDALPGHLTTEEQGRLLDLLALNFDWLDKEAGDAGRPAEVEVNEEARVEVGKLSTLLVAVARLKKKAKVGIEKKRTMERLALEAAGHDAVSLKVTQLEAELTTVRLQLETAEANARPPGCKCGIKKKRKRERGGGLRGLLKNKGTVQYSLKESHLTIAKIYEA